MDLAEIMCEGEGLVIQLAEDMNQC